MKLCFALIVMIFSPLSYAEVSVAFLEVRNYQGHVVQLEPGGKYAHVAISYQGKWLHAHPLKGVVRESTEQLSKIGEIKKIVILSLWQNLSEQEVEKYLGKPYDSEFSWSDDKMYCSELVAKILKIPPQKMYFDPKLWPPKFQKHNGEPGISPDFLSQYL